jgi:crossover junction endodeoxyribonuclease RuvC
MRVLGIDPGLTRCGIGVVESQEGKKLRLVDYGVIRTESAAPLEERLLSLDSALMSG